MLAASNTRREQGASLQKFLILLKVSDFFHSYSTRDSAAITVMSLEGTSSSSGDGGTSSAAGLATEGVRTPLSEEDFKHRYGLKWDWKLPLFHRIYTDHPCLPGSFGG